MYGYDYSGVPTYQLARETLARSRDVWDVNEEALKRLAAAFVAFAVSVFFVHDPVVALLLASPLILYWIMSLAACADYAAEMKARRIELESRRRQTAPSVQQ